MQIDPARDIGLRHAAPAADARGHLAGQRFDIRGHGWVMGGEFMGKIVGRSSTAPVPGGSVMFPDIAHSKAIG
jgi:hypothetical protein